MGKLSEMPRPVYKEAGLPDPAGEEEPTEWTESMLLYCVTLIEKVNAIFCAVPVSSARKLLSASVYEDLMVVDLEIEEFLKEWNGEEED